VLQILYEDASVLVCVKEAGIASQSPGMPEEIARHLGGENPYVGVVHRLDRDVSGVMVYALTEKAAAALSAQITDGSLKKEYAAVLKGEVPESGELRDLLYHDPRGNKTYVVDRMRRGVREAVLEYRIAARASAENGILSLADIRLHTGRTHQIRVQFGSRRYPVAGDARYGGGKGQIALFSRALTLRHPVSGKEMRFTALPPRTEAWAYFSEEDFSSLR